MADHGRDCACTRCSGFQPGNRHGLETRFQPGHELSLRHGAYSMLRLSPRVDELAETVRDLVPAYRPADDVAVQLLAVALARIEAAWSAIDGASPEDVKSLEEMLRGWVNSAARQADKLAMTPTARGRLGLDVAQTRRALTLTDLHAEAELEQTPAQEVAS